MRTIIWFIYFWVSLFILSPVMLYAFWLRKTEKKEQLLRLCNRFVRGWMGSLLWIAGVQVEVSGLELIPDMPVLFIGNHQSNFDVPIVLCYLDRAHGIVAKEELKKIPFIRHWMQFFGCVFIDRNNPRKSIAALSQAAENIRNGISMVIFPEGTRSRDGQVGQFKAGGFKIAQKTRVPIVPICIDGSINVMPPKQMWIHPAKVKLRILPPIETAHLSREEFRGLEDTVREQIIENKGR